MRFINNALRRNAASPKQTNKKKKPQTPVQICELNFFSLEEEKRPALKHKSTLQRDTSLCVRGVESVRVNTKCC